MNELLQKLLESNILSEDTKKELEEAFKVKLTEAVEVAKAEAAAQVRVELTEKWVIERDQLVEAIDKKVEDLLSEEVKELKADIESYRNLEVEYAEKLHEKEAQMRDEVKSDMKELLENIDSFLDFRIAVEMDELKEDIAEVRKLEFGRRLFETFVQEYRDKFVDEDSVEAELAETRESLRSTKRKLKESQTQHSELIRKNKLNDLLSNIDGPQREIMETVLSNVPTDKLDDAYGVFLKRVVKESSSTSSEKEKNEVLAEGAGAKTPVAVAVTGDKTDVLEESTTPKLSDDARALWQRMAGIR